MLTRTLVAVTVTLSASMATAGIANADYIQNQGTFAGDVIRQLQDWGYDVMLNGRNGDASYLDPYQQRDCQVLGTYPTVAGPIETGTFQTVYVELDCRQNPGSTTVSGN